MNKLNNQIRFLILYYSILQNVIFYCFVNNKIKYFILSKKKEVRIYEL